MGFHSNRCVSVENDVRLQRMLTVNVTEYIVQLRLIQSNGGNDTEMVRYGANTSWGALRKMSFNVRRNISAKGFRYVNYEVKSILKKFH